MKKVPTHPKKTLSMNIHLTPPTPSTIPTPVTPPMVHCVVETGIPKYEANTTDNDVESSMTNPRDGLNLVRRYPIEMMTLYPRMAKPATIPKPPINNTHFGTGESLVNTPVS